MSCFVFHLPSFVSVSSMSKTLVKICKNYNNSNFNNNTKNNIFSKFSGLMNTLLVLAATLVVVTLATNLTDNSTAEAVKDKKGKG